MGLTLFSNTRIFSLSDNPPEQIAVIESNATTSFYPDNKMWNLQNYDSKSKLLVCIDFSHYSYPHFTNFKSTNNYEKWAHILGGSKIEKFKNLDKCFLTLQIHSKLKSFDTKSWNQGCGSNHTFFALIPLS